MWWEQYYININDEHELLYCELRLEEEDKEGEKEMYAEMTSEEKRTYRHAMNEESEHCEIVFLSICIHQFCFLLR